MFEETPDPGPLSLARGAPTTMADLYDAAADATRKADFLLSGVALREQAYDDRIDAIRKATGIAAPPNPIRDWQIPGLGVARGDRVAAFDAWLREQQVQFPELADVIRADVPPELDARRKSFEAEHRLADRASRYDGMAWVPQLLGGFRASFEDPVTLMAMAAGPWGKVGLGAGAVLWAGVKAGAVNMAAEAVSQPVVQAWRRDAGLDYGLSRAAGQVAAAGLLGFGVDAGLRGLARGVRGGLGHQPVLDPAGKVTGWRRGSEPEAVGAAASEPAAPALEPVPARVRDPDRALQEAAASAPAGSPLRRAADGDPDAMHEMARAVGLGDDATLRGAHQAAVIDREMAAQIQPHLPASPMATASGFDRFVQSVRAAVDPSEPIPAPLPEVPAAAVARGAGADATALAPHHAAARQQLINGDGDVVAIAAALRERPAIIDDEVPVTGLWRTAAALSRLSDAAFAEVASGRTEPLAAALVADHVADPKLHTALLEDLRSLGPQATHADLRRAIATGLEPRHGPAAQAALFGVAPEPPGPRAGLADPSAASTKPVADAIEARLADTIEDAQARAAGKPTRDDEVLQTLIERALPAGGRGGGVGDDGGPLYALADYFTETGIDHLARANGATSILKLRPWSKSPSRVLAFHGSPTAFERFDINRSADFGIHFGTVDQANRFAEGRAANVMPAVLDVANVLTVPDLNRWAPRELVAALRGRGAEISPFARALADRAASDVELRPHAYAAIGDDLTRQGVDGLRYLNKHEGGGITWSYIVWEPGRVSSATSGDPLYARSLADAALLSGRFGHTARATADLPHLRAEIEAAVRKVAPDGTAVRLSDDIGRGIDGYFDPHERLIHIALSAADPLRVGMEEAGHALKRAGLFTATEYRLLTDYATRHGLRQAFAIDERYLPVYGKRWQGDKARVEAALTEETVMQMLARHATGERWGDAADQGLMAELADRFWRIINAIREVLGARGYHAIDDIFRGFESGDIAARELAARQAAVDPLTAAGSDRQVLRDAADLVGACKHN